MKSLDHFSLGIASRLLWESVASKDPRALIQQARDHLDNVLERLDKPRANTGPEVLVEPEESPLKRAALGMDLATGPDRTAFFVSVPCHILGDDK